MTPRRRWGADVDVGAEWLEGLGRPRWQFEVAQKGEGRLWLRVGRTIQACEPPRRSRPKS